MVDEEKNSDNRLITVSEWDAELPTGNWSGPYPIELFPPAVGKSSDLADIRHSFRDSHIRSDISKENHEKLKIWVDKKIPDYMHWLIQGLEFYHPSVPITFYALNSDYLSKEDNQEFTLSHPEIFDISWNDDLDKLRALFLQQLSQFGCNSSLISDEEAVDGGVLNLKGYSRPRALMAGDVYPGSGGEEKLLWRYFTLPKFVRLLQTDEIWFSRPQYLDDPHEFATNFSTQTSLIEWRLNSFCREYNRAIKSQRDVYLNNVRDLVEGLSKSNDGLIEKQSIKFSELSPLLLSSIRENLKRWQESYCISCWRYSEHDSVAMWNQYASLDEGIAISISIDKLRSSFKQSGDIRLEIITYQDMNNHSDPMTGLPLGYKDIRFQSEEEARFYFPMPDKLERTGFGIKVNLEDILDTVYLSPNANFWFKDIVNDLLNKFSLNIDVQDSPLGRMPNKF